MDHLLEKLRRPDWHRATSLTERLALLRTHAIESDAEHATRQMRLWRGQSPFNADTYFAQRLHAEGTTEDEFRRLLGMTAERLHLHAATPSWLTTLAASYVPSPGGKANPPLPQALQRSKLAAFLNAVAPLVNTGCDRLRAGMQLLAAGDARCPFDPVTAESLLLGCLPGALLRILSRTLVLELNAARLDGALEGTTAEERFASFGAALRQPDTAVGLMLQYPVLARQAVLCVDNWVASSLEFLRHLCADSHLIRGAFALGDDPGRLEALEGNLGDRHRSGRSVLRARFTSGCEVVYKPRSLAVDVHFQELLAWLNDRGHQPGFQTLAILDRGTHGWVPFVRRQSCTSADEVRRFFERHGGYLAVLYALEATDFHHENLIAAGEHPVLLDLEALFHPRINASANGPDGPSANDALTHSVMRVGLLPERMWSTDTRDGIDISGIGASGGQLTPDAVPQWEGIGTDTMRFTRKRVPIPAGVNRPMLNGVDVEALEYADALAAGFTSTYQLLLEHRAGLLANEGPLARFGEDEVRVLIRPTRIYAKVLEESFHPDLLRDALDRERFFDRLWVGVEDAPHVACAIRAEKEDLSNIDIPLFTTRPGSRNVWTSRGEPIPEVLSKSALTSVRRRIERLSPHDLDVQRWFIKASLSTLSTGRYHAPVPSLRRRPSRTRAGATKLVAAAREIGARLEASALRSDDGVSWIGVTPRGDHRWSVMPLNNDLYGGLPGVALFLAYLGSVTQEARYTTLARAALSTALHQVRHDASEMQSIGAFTGWGGLIYVLGQLGVMWHDADLVDEAAAIVRILPPLIAKDEAFDIVDGAAGCIGGLLALHACAPSADVLAAATACGDRLLGNARPMPQGAGWIPEKAGTPLAGFAHGAAGIAWALLHLAAATGQDRFRGTAREAIAYERTLFSPEAGNWADLRPGKTDLPRSFMTAWCHGAAGIGLARLDTLPHLDDSHAANEIEVALNTTAAHGLGGSHCLCHGDLGNLELLLQASRSGCDRRWTTVIEEAAAATLDDIETCGYSCGSPADVETPGLMTGLAGIGYGLLRLAQPDAVPSVLVLEPHQPRRT
jgi:type 2 lantibiotic biosynthesis protein LanM